jgi:hypothetical protein
MSTPITAYQAVDGTIFPTQKEANQHENMLAKRQMIMDFINSPDNTLGKDVKDERRLLQFIAAWEEYQKAH